MANSHWRASSSGLCAEVMRVIIIHTIILRAEVSPVTIAAPVLREKRSRDNVIDRLADLAREFYSTYDVRRRESRVVRIRNQMMATS